MRRSLLGLLLAVGACTPVTEGPDDADGDGYTEADGDCDDSDAGRFPGAPESCDGADEDCDGAIDEDVETTTWYADTDGDGFGDVDAPAAGCAAPEGYVADATDCDDTHPARNPDARELCDGLAVDDDCDGEVDEADCRPFGSRTADELATFLAWDEPATGELTLAMATGDVDEDGRSDLIVAQPDRSDGVIAFAFPDGMVGSAPGVVGITTSGGFDVESAGASVAWVEAAGSRGEPWLAVGAPDTPGYDAGAVMVVEGAWTRDRSPTLLLDAQVVAGTDGAVRFGAAVAAAGRFDNDDVDDLAIGDPEAAPDGVALAVYAGGRSLLTLVRPDCTWASGDDATQAGAALARGGDLDGDGLDDLLVGAPEGRASTLDPRAGWVAVVRGGTCDGLLTNAGPLYVGDEDGQRLGAAVAGGGDVDGDGYVDFVAGLPGRAADAAGGALLFPGGAGIDGTQAARDAALAYVQGDLRGGHHGAAVAIVGDVDADRYADVALAGPDPDLDHGWTLVGLWYGGPGLPVHDYASAPDLTLLASCTDGSPFAVPLVGLGDGFALASGCVGDSPATARGVYVFEPEG